MSIKKYLEKSEDLTGKEILVTGGTSGIGLALVKQLLSKNAKVVVLARDLQKAEMVKNSLLENYENPDISFIHYDQSDDESVVKVAKEIAENHPDFYALVLNAGMTQRKKPTRFVDGYPVTLKTNYIGLALLLENLLPLLKGKHRFIFQGSLAAAAHLKKINSFKDTNISFWQQYFISKAGVEALFYHYSHSESPHEFICVEPGIAITGIVREFSNIIKSLARTFSKVFSHSADKAALTALCAIQSTTPSGSFIIPRGLFHLRGYPKIKKFPKRRMRPYLVEMLKKN